MYVLTSSDKENETFIWDLESGTIVSTLKDSHPSNNGITFLSSYDNPSNVDYIITGRIDKQMLYVWKMGKESPILRSGISEKVKCIRTTSDGLFLLCGGISGILYMWDIISGKLLRFWNGHYKSINCLEICNNDSYLISSSDDSLICIWELSRILNICENEIRPFHIFSNHTLPITSICSMRNDNYFISSSLDCTINLYHIPSKSMLMSIIFPNQINSCILSPSFDEIYGGSIDGKIYYINLNYNSISKQYYCNNILQYNKLMNNENNKNNKNDISYMYYHKMCITKLELCIENNIIISGYENGEIILWDMESKQIIRIISTYHTCSINNIMLLNKPKGMNSGYDALFIPVSFKKYLENDKRISESSLYCSLKSYNSDKMKNNCNMMEMEEMNEIKTASGIKTIDSMTLESKSIQEEDDDDEKEEDKELDKDERIMKLENSNKALKSMNKELLSYASELASQLINK